MRIALRRRFAGLVMLGLAAMLPMTAVPFAAAQTDADSPAEKPAEMKADAPADTVSKTPTRTPADVPPLSHMVPEGTLLYKGWPGIDTVARSAKDTALAELLREPEIVRLREAWWTELWPAINTLVIREFGGRDGARFFGAAEDLLAAVWRYPTAAAVIGVEMGEAGPRVDAAIIVQAGDDAGQLAAGVEALLAATGMEIEGVAEVQVGDATLKELPLLGPTMPLRWGVFDEYFVITIGTKMSEYLAAGDDAKSLAESERFAAAMEVVGGSASTPTVFVDIKGVVKTLESFQPMLAGFALPVLGEEGGMRKLLAQWGLDSLESLSIVMVPEAGGFKTTSFLHAPRPGEGAGTALVSSEPLTDADLAVVPKEVSWATVTSFDLAGCYRGLLSAIGVIAPDVHEQTIKFIADLEEKLGVNIEKDVLGSFGNTWAMFDAPSHGGLWITGITVVGEVKPDNRLDVALNKIIKAIAEEADPDARVAVSQEEYRSQTISFVNVAGVPMPIAPAWAQYKGRWIVALYPQMVRLTLDHLMDERPSLLANEDFQRGRALMPASPSSINYVDTRAGVRQLYTFVLPIAQMLMAMGQKQGIPADVSMLPSASTVTRHLFGNVSATTKTDKGVLMVSHGAVPVAIPALGEGGTMVPLMMSVMLPSLARARELSRRTVSAANLAGIGTAMYAYANEHDDKFPPDFKTLIDQGSISPKQLISPLERLCEAECSYIYIDGQTTQADPRNVLAYEKLVNYDGEGTDVLFVDTHVEFLNMQGFKKVLQETCERLDRRMPEIETPNAGKPRGMSFGKRVKAALGIAVAQVSPDGVLATALQLFRMHMGRYPKDLNELTEKPDGEADAEKWAGPYINGSRSLEDPWGNELKYRCPGKHNKDRYDLWSLGPDGADGTDDDIANWAKD